MAKVERDQGRDAPTFDLSEEDVDARWAEFLDNYSAEGRRVTEMWNELGEKYKSLGLRHSI